MGRITALPDGLEWRGEHEVLRVRAWGRDALRVQAGLHEIREDIPHALLPLEEAPAPTVSVQADGEATVDNGAIRAYLGPGGTLRFCRTADDTVLLAEEPAHFWWPGSRVYAATGNGYHRLEQRFAAYPGERLFGLGQHTHGLLDQKGAVVDLVHRNGEISIPLLLSSRGYALLWNSPAVGRVELGTTGTRWVADSARQIDYWVAAGPPGDVLQRYAEVTGRPPPMPYWATGFWQSKLRYRTQDELLAVAREYRRRELPLSVIVCDFFHAPHFGDWRFDPADWPDPGAMVAELAELDVRLMVSVWPSATSLSANYQPMLHDGLLVRTERGVPVLVQTRDKGADGPLHAAFYDPTDPRARRYVWEQVREGYLRYGIDIWWLDAGEPEIRPSNPDNLLYHAGPGTEVANLYPRENARTFWEGMHEAGRAEVLTLNRSAWAGSQRYGAAVWSGDIQPTFESLAQQVRAGLSMACSGIAWWTTDIGGFHGGRPDDPYFRELMVRWFQFGVFCPLTRLHGHREPREEFGPTMTGGPNEVWSFGEEVYQILREQLFLRERLRPYVVEQMDVASHAGLPPMRPAFVDFPEDPVVWDVSDEYVFGPDLLVCPVLSYGARSREVYLPEGTGWYDGWTGEQHSGGTVLDAAAPLERIPVYVRAGATVPLIPGSDQPSG